MDVVSACVHHRGCDTVAARGHCITGVGQAGLLTNRQGIHISAEDDRRARAIGQKTNDPGATDPGLHAQSEPAQPSSQSCGSLELLKRQLRVSMQVFVESDEFLEAISRKGRKAKAIH